MNAPAHLSRIKGGEHLAAAYEAIRQHGIREARAAHMARLERCRSLHNLHMFAAAIHPAQSAGEALEDAKAFLRSHRRKPRYERAFAARQVREAKEMIAVCRYFRRYAERIWAREAA